MHITLKFALLIATLTVSIHANAAYMSSGDLILTPGKARAITFAWITINQNPVADYAGTFAAVKEEGLVVGTNSDNCSLDSGEGEPTYCETTATATDESITFGCEYCGFGDTTFKVHGTTITVQAWGTLGNVCDVIEPRSGGGGMF